MTAISNSISLVGVWPGGFDDAGVCFFNIAWNLDNMLAATRIFSGKFAF